MKQSMNAKYNDKYRLMGLRIALYRKLAGYTQESFAEMVGISLNYLSQIEAPNIVRRISLDTLFKIADTLDVPIGKLLDE